MPDIEERLAKLEAVDEIRNLIASYGPLADRGDADGVAKLWTADGEYEVGGYGTAKGHDQIGDLIRSSTHQGLMATGCAHVLSPHTIKVDSDMAHAVGYSIVLRKSGEVFEPWRVSANKWMLTRTPDGWRVARRENAPLDGAETSLEILRNLNVT